MKIQILLSLLLAQQVFAGGLPVTPEEQSAMTPDSVLQDLIKGNERYISGEMDTQDVSASIDAATKGQFPKAYVLSCIDSRVPVEMVFDQGIGDIFVGRVAGNVENIDQLGSMEYAAKVAGVKLIMVLGHQSCGAVKGACDHVKLGNVTALLHNIKPAVQKAKSKVDGEHSSKNKKFVDKVIKYNVKQTIDDILDQSPVLTEMVNAGDLKIVGGVYSLHSGKVEILDHS